MKLEDIAILIQMDLLEKAVSYEDTAKHYLNIIEYYKLCNISKSSSEYQIAKCEYRKAKINSKSVIDRFNWIKSKLSNKAERRSRQNGS